MANMKFMSVNQMIFLKERANTMTCHLTDQDGRAGWRKKTPVCLSLDTNILINH